MTSRSLKTLEQRNLTMKELNSNKGIGEEDNTKFRLKNKTSMGVKKSTET